MLSYWSGVATLTGIYLIATLGVSILVGFTGLFSLGHAGFMAIGAYGTALSIKALSIADHACVLEQGRIVKQGTGSEIAADESIINAYLGAKK